MVSPGSSRTSAGPPTSTSPVYVSALIEDSDRECRRPPLRSAAWTLAQPRDPDGSGSGIVGLPATEIAARVRSGELSAVDVVRAHLAHIDAVDARIGAFRVVRTRGGAGRGRRRRRRARPRLALPLAGVPIAVKDNVAVAGEVVHRRLAAPAPTPGDARTTPSSPGCARPAPIVVGITRVPELCLYGATDGPGTVSRNPWDTARSAGRVSSGGSAAAVAAGLRAARPRQRRHGLAAAAGRRLRAGHAQARARAWCPAEIGADSWSGMAENGALATTVADLAVAHAVLAGERAGAAAGARPARCGSPSPPARRCPGVRADAAGAGRGRRGRRPS